MNKRRFNLEGKTVLVTGGAGALGAAIALGVAGQGADVVVTDIREEAAENIAAEVRALGRRAVAFECDVSDQKQVADVVGAACQELGGVDVLVNVAGGRGVETRACDDTRRV